MKRSHLTFVYLLLILIVGTRAHGFEVTLAWDPNTEPDIIGYTLYTRESDSGTFRQTAYFPLDEIDPDNPRYTITDMASDITYNFAVTALNSAGLESRFSNQVSVLNGRAVFTGTSGGGGGGGCFVSTSETQTQSRYKKFQDIANKAVTAARRESYTPPVSHPSVAVRDDK